jgi:hypothetical protein
VGRVAEVVGKICVAIAVLGGACGAIAYALGVLAPDVAIPARRALFGMSVVLLFDLLIPLAVIFFACAIIHGSA